MFFSFVVGLICVSIALTVLTQSLLVPFFAAFFLYLFLNMREKFKEEQQ